MVEPGGATMICPGCISDRGVSYRSRDVSVVYPGVSVADPGCDTDRSRDVSVVYPGMCQC